MGLVRVWTHGLALLCRGGGVRFSVLAGILQQFLDALVLGVGVCVGCVCVCGLFNIWLDGVSL